MNRIHFLIIVALSLFSCTNKPKPSINENKSFSREESIKLNKSLLQDEEEAIDAYVKRHELKVTKTESGLLYWIYKDSVGEVAKNNMYATLNYKVSLLDGTLCYTSDSLGPAKFLIERDDVESGLHEGVCYLSEGDKAIIILPPHLAHGLLGDWDKIPAYSSVIYDIELLELSEN